MNKDKRAFRIRYKLKSSGDRLRLSVHRTNLNVYAQIIDDATGTTIASASTLGTKAGSNKEQAKAIGVQIGKLALDKGITQVVFDRGAFPYHGRIAAVADGAREAGLDF